MSATAADTAYARDALLRGALEVQQLSALSDRTLGPRYIEQLSTWGLPDLAWRLAARFDTLGTRPAERGYSYTSRLASELLQRGDTTLLDRQLALVSAGVRDGALQLAAQQLPCAPPLAAWVTARISVSFERARATTHFSEQCEAQDTAARRRALRAAFEMVRADTGIWASVYAVQWLEKLRDLGGTVTALDVLAAPRVGRRNWEAQWNVSRTLIKFGFSSAALTMMDSALANAPPGTNRAYIRAGIHDLRGSAADSLIAKTIRDSVAATFRPAQANSRPVARSSPSMPYYPLYEAVRKSDRTKLPVELAEALRRADSVKVLIDLGITTHGLISPAENQYVLQSTRDSLRAFAPFLYSEIERTSATLAAEWRDSVRAAALSFLTLKDPPLALKLAGALELGRFRERATAEGLRALSEFDADRAEQMAATLRDPIARDIVYPELTRRAVAGGRLSLARDLAERTAGGEARARAHLALATAELQERRPTNARARIAALLPALDPLWKCLNNCNFGVPADPQAIDRRLLGDVVLLALRLDLANELTGWARTRHSAEKRAAAWLVVAEAVSQYRLNRYVDYRAY